LWADLGPGDPGYRLRPGRTGFDPLEQQQEFARFQGLAYKSIFWNRYTRHLTTIAFAALLAFLAFEGNFAAIGVIAIVAGAIGLLSRISGEHVRELRRKHRRPDMPFKSYDGEM
jgi:hypothetical protein